MKLLVPIDGSELSLQALEQAVRLHAEGLRVELVLVNVQEPASVYELVTLQDAQAVEQVTLGAGQDLLAPAIQKAKTAGVPFESRVMVGDPVSMMLEAMEELGCDAVIMGSHGKGLVRSAWLGSVSREMLEKSPVPVTFVKPAPDESLA